MVEIDARDSYTPSLDQEDRQAQAKAAAARTIPELVVTPEPPDDAEGAAPSGRELCLLGFMAVLMLLPVTLPVSVLRGLVHDRFAVSELMTSMFMSINMVGAVLCAPIAGALADSFGRRKQMIVGALVADAACMWAMTASVPFPVFMGIRFVEGCAHIFALSLLLSLAADRAPRIGRAKMMGIVGGCISLGVALGAPLGGVLGRQDVLRPLYVSTGVLLVAAALAALVLRDVRRRGSRPGMRQIARIVLEDRGLAVPMAFAFVDRFTVGFFVATFPLYMRRMFDLPAAQIGFMLSLFLLPFALLSIVFGRLSERVSRSLLVAGGSLLYGACLMTLGWWSIAALPYLMCTLGVLSAVMFVPSLVMVSDLATPRTRSTCLGGFNAAGSLGFIIGPLVGGLVSQTIGTSFSWQTGYTAAFVVAGAAEVLCVLVAFSMMRRLVAQGRTT